MEGYTLKTILLTGFDPFNGETTNPSYEIVRRLDGTVIGEDAKIVGRGLPTAFSNSAETLIAIMEDVKPDVVLCLGEAGRRTRLTPERVAINVIDARIPDNEGKQLIDVPIAEDGPAAYFSGLPIKSMVERMRADGVPASVSDTAGTYVCNYIFYRLMHHLDRTQAKTLGGFMHVPYMAEQALDRDVPSMPVDLMVRGVRSALAAIMTAF
nr:pyroglutamyl-peptidase I [Alicyclobacillus acidiphilus]